MERSIWLVRYERVMLGADVVEQRLRNLLLPGVRRLGLLPILKKLRARIRPRHESVPVAPGQDGDDEHRVSDYWGQQFQAMRADNSYWLNNKLVEESTYRLMTDAPTHWLGWLLHEYFAQRTFERSLSVCCGDGAHEIQLYASGKVRYVSGVDISAGAIAQARARFESAGATQDQYRFEVGDVNNLTVDGTFDLILSTGALHHTTNLERLLSAVQGALTPDGYFVVVEFIGPDRFQWTDRQIEIANQVLRAIDPAYLRDGRNTRFERPTVESMLACDPSEAVRSSEVYPLVKRHFDVRYERWYNGTLLHQLHPLLRTEWANQGKRDFDSIVRLILLLEDLLVKGSLLPSDFVFLICQKPASGTRRPA
ncbi:MAG: class I SAM-dependent methyltransferase [Nitrospira sp.]|nr:methyltransferase domain-containing protein [Nitrospira sp.]MCW5788371.1 methyltransferase domain-containing protein [Nitrospira sp.]MDR4472235.1 class I SAM-dependent methyltransferase [Nitrospira sp.]MDR4477613.1 class I SAM-dependent methyltransferase [Nitrospira sp.]